MNTLKPILDFYIAKGGKTAWCQHYMAINTKGHPVSEYNCDAIRWCLTGAVHATALKHAACIKMNTELFARVGLSVSIWNDSPSRTYEEVILMLSQNDSSMVQ